MLKCPTCHIPLCGIEYESCFIQICPDGHGALVDEYRLDRIKRTRQKKWSVGDDHRFAAEVLAADALGPVRCPKCLAETEKLKLSAGDVVFRVDRCKPCGVIWLDRGELELVQIAYEKELDGRTPEDWNRIERAATAQMQLKEQAIAEVEALQPNDKPSLGGVLTSTGLGRYSAPASLVLGAALMATQACGRCLQDGLGESDRVRRNGSLLAALFFFLVVVGALVWLWYRFMK
jgi:Zn-finger nucleic acid-binding protein